MSSSTPSAKITRLNCIMRQLFFNKEVDSKTLWELSGACCKRTFERDMEYLRDKHCAEIVYDPAKKSYSLTNKGTFLPTIPLTESEILGMAAGIKFAEYLLPYLKNDMMSLWSRIKAVMPDDITKKGEAFRRHSIIAMPKTKINSRIWDILVDSIQKELPIRISYRPASGKKASQTVLSPWWLIFKYHSWHLVGGREDHSDIHICPIASIESAMIWDEEPYKNPPKIVSQSWIASNWTGKPGDKEIPIKVTILPPLSKMASFTIWHPSQKILPMPDETSILEAIIPESALEDVARWILARAPLAIPVYPEELILMIERFSAELSEKMKGSMLSPVQTRNAGS